MDISSVNSDLIRGNVTTIILGCLLHEDRYGYEILKEIEDKSNSQYVLKQATLYNQLKRLEKQGLVSSYDGDPDDTGGGKRRYYTLTPEGRQYLVKERSEYEYSRTILDKLVSEKEFDFTKEIPFDASELRPYSKREPQETKIVYKDKVVEVEKPVEVEKIVYQDRVVEVEKPVEIEKIVEVEKIVERPIEVERVLYFDTYGNEVTKEQLDKMRAKAHEDEIFARSREEELRLANERLREREQEFAHQNELLQLKDEQLKKSEDDKELVKSLLRSMQEDKLREDEERRRLEEIELAKRLEEEEKLKTLERTPSQTLEEMFAKLDAESEYKRPAPVKQQEVLPDEKPVEHTYINAFSNQPTYTQAPQTTLRDIFKQLDKKEAEIDANNKEVAEFAPQEKVEQLPIIEEREEQIGYAYDHANPDGYSATAAVINRQEGGFDYEKDNVNYRDFFYSIAADTNEQTHKPIKQSIDYADSDIKTRLYAKGFKIRPYDRGNTSEYYTFNFLQSNRINRDVFLIVLAFFAVEIAIMWASLATRIAYTYFLPFLCVGVALCLIPTVVYLINPTKRKRANFNFKLSILNRSMMFIELAVVCVLIGFFALGASVNDIDLILQSIVLPIVLLTNIPLSSLIHWLLYRSRRYHIA